MKIQFMTKKDTVSEENLKGNIHGCEALNVSVCQAINGVRVTWVG